MACLQILSHHFEQAGPGVCRRGFEVHKLDAFPVVLDAVGGLDLEKIVGQWAILPKAPSSAGSSPQVLLEEGVTDASISELGSQGLVR